MRLLVDTHLWIWFAQGDARLSLQARQLIDDPENDVLFSAVNIWEVAVKFGLNQIGFQVDPAILRRRLLANAFEELAVRGDHATALLALPRVHRDPFDRMLVAQAIVEERMQLTADRTLAKYPATQLV